MEGYRGDEIELEKRKSKEEAPIFTYTLFDRYKKFIGFFENPDDKLTLEAIYKLYVGECIENNIEPLAMEDLSMNKI